MLALAAAVAGGLLATRLGYEPIWDGRVYGTCISDAARNFTPEAIRCAGHASHVYAGAAALVQKIAPDSPVPLLVFNAVLYLLACAGFHRLAGLLFPSATRLDRALVVAVFSVHPAFLAAVVQPGLDLPLLPEFIWTLVFILERRWVPLVLVGSAMAFTKETGVLLYAVVLACYGFWFALRPPGTARERVVRLLRLAPLALPGLLFVGYLGLRRVAAPTQAVIWHNSSTGESLLAQFLVPRLDLYQVNYAVLILILGFAWIPAAIVALDAFVGTVRAGHRLPRRVVGDADANTLGFATLVTVATGYALTRFTTFGHTRYFLVLYALMLVLMVASLARLGVPATVRRGVLASYALLLALSAVRTIDPVSRSLYGTFAFGSHDMLRMTRITGECCAYGHDQLVYSLEFTVFQRLVDDALAGTVGRRAQEVGTGGEPPVVVVPDSTSWLLIEPSPTGPRGFDYRPFRGQRLEVLEHRAVSDSSNRPDSLTFIALPNGNSAGALRALQRTYDVSPPQWFRHDGYALAAYHLTLRNTVP